MRGFKHAFTSNTHSHGLWQPSAVLSLFCVVVSVAARCGVCDHGDWGEGDIIGGNKVSNDLCWIYLFLYHSISTYIKTTSNSWQIVQISVKR